jgi:hypothetical protein
MGPLPATQQALGYVQQAILRSYISGCASACVLLCRHAYDAFLVVHGTDTLAYTASALSLMLVGKSCATQHQHSASCLLINLALASTLWVTVVGYWQAL